MSTTRLLVPATVALAASVACGDDHPPPAPVAVNPQGTAFRDESSRQVVLRGVNFRGEGIFDGSQRVGAIPPFTGDDCARIADDFGMNLIRLPMNWSLLEPTQGTFDPSFIERIQTLIAECHEVGVFTLVDLHQDGWSRFVGDDGAPLWAHTPPLPPADGSGGGGSEFYQDDIYANYQAFYDQKDGLQDAYVDMLGRLTRALRGQEGIIGIEIMNEPVELPFRWRLWDFYERATAAIRDNWREVPIYFEPDASRNISDESFVPGTFYDDNAVYAPHIYTGLFFDGNQWEVGDVERIRDSMNAARDEAAQYGAGILIGEMGSGIDSEYGYAWSDAAFGVADELGLSWAMWLYEEWNSVDDGIPWGLYNTELDEQGALTQRELRPTGIVLFARPFPRAVPGSISSFAFDRDSRVFSLQTDETEGRFELAAPQLVYPYDVAISCDGAAVSATRHLGTVQFECAARDVQMAPANEPADATVPYADALAAVRGDYPWQTRIGQTRPTSRNR